MNEKLLDALRNITAIMLSAQGDVGIVSGAIVAIAAIIKAITGESASLADIIALIKQVGTEQHGWGVDELARIDALLAQTQG